MDTIAIWLVFVIVNAIVFGFLIGWLAGHVRGQCLGETATMPGEVDRHRRVAEALDLLVAEKEEMLKGKESDFMHLNLEWQDLSDELTRTKQDLELARLQLAGRESSDG